MPLSENGTQAWDSKPCTREGKLLQSPTLITTNCTADLCQVRERRLHQTIRQTRQNPLQPNPVELESFHQKSDEPSKMPFLHSPFPKIFGASRQQYCWSNPSQAGPNFISADPVTPPPPSAKPPLTEHPGLAGGTVPSGVEKKNAVAPLLQLFERSLDSNVLWRPPVC